MKGIIVFMNLKILHGRIYRYVFSSNQKSISKLSPVLVHMGFLINDYSLKNNIRKLYLKIGNKNYKSRIKTIYYHLNFFYSSSLKNYLNFLFINLYFIFKNKNILRLINTTYIDIKF